tara:strand:+ start:1438 stop:1983 length:546 start_codon:yes stop_codon:yes gene_type:complete
MKISQNKVKQIISEEISRVTEASLSGDAKYLYNLFFGRDAFHYDKARDNLSRAKKMTVKFKEKMRDLEMGYRMAQRRGDEKNVRYFEKVIDDLADMATEMNNLNEIYELVLKGDEDLIELGMEMVEELGEQRMSTLAVDAKIANELVTRVEDRIVDAGKDMFQRALAGDRFPLPKRYKDLD